MRPAHAAEPQRKRAPSCPLDSAAPMPYTPAVAVGAHGLPMTLPCDLANMLFVSTKQGAAP
jgi:hypothetical protein